MGWLADAALFITGVYVGLRLVAALYRPLDLWYRIETAYPQAVRGIIVWGGGAAALAALLDGRHRTAFVLGLAAFAVFYLSLYLLRHLVVRKPASPD